MLKKINQTLNRIHSFVGGTDNFLIICLVVLVLTLLLVIWRLENLIIIFENMCYYDFPENYTCNCIFGKGKTDLINFSIKN